MLIGVAFDEQLRLSAEDLVALAVMAARLGFDSVWTPRRADLDPFELCRHWHVNATRANGRRLRTGIGVLPVPGAWDVDELADRASRTARSTGGDFVLGIGTGGYGAPFWTRLGLPNQPIRIMRELLTRLRSRLAADGAHAAGGVRVPVYLGALGPQMVRLAGECADGVCLNWAPPSSIASSLAQVESGTVAAGRARSDVAVMAYLRVCLDDDAEVARRALASMVLRALDPGGRRSDAPGRQLGYRGHFARLGFEPELAALDRLHESGAELPTLIDAVPDELCRQAGYYGTAEAAAAHVRELAHGLDEVVLRIVASQPSTIAGLATAMEALAPVCDG